tara:strand:+ start:384 stop:563 length:180 start_codon:yes stop_codon:yes gene_type:complete
MRRFKKKLLGWLTPKVIEKKFVMTRHLNSVLMDIDDEVLSIESISKNVTMIIIRKHLKK